MEKTVIKAGSPVLAKERKLIREIIEELKSKHGKTTVHCEFRRIEEKYGGYSDGYHAVYSLIESGKKERLLQELKLSFATYGSNWNYRDQPERIVVCIWGNLRSTITEPRKKNLYRAANNIGNEITFHRDRPRHIQANAVAKLLLEQQERFDKGKELILSDMVQWDIFAKAVKRVKSALNIPDKNIRRTPVNSEYEVELSIPETKKRKASSVIRMDVDGSISIKIDDLGESKLLKIVNAFK